VTLLLRGEFVAVEVRRFGEQAGTGSCLLAWHGWLELPPTLSCMGASRARLIREMDIPIVAVGKLRAFNIATLYRLEDLYSAHSQSILQSTRPYAFTTCLKLHSTFTA
jgi:hypothetical protein